MLAGSARRLAALENAPLLRELLDTLLRSAAVAEVWADRVLADRAAALPVHGQRAHAWLAQPIGFLLATDVPWCLALTDVALQLWAPWQGRLSSDRRRTGVPARETWLVPLTALPTVGVAAVGALLDRAERVFAHGSTYGQHWNACRLNADLDAQPQARCVAATHFVRALLRALEAAGAPRFALLLELQRALAELLPAQVRGGPARQWVLDALCEVTSGAWPAACGATGAGPRACAHCYHATAGRSEYARSVEAFEEARVAAEERRVRVQMAAADQEYVRMRSWPSLLGDSQNRADGASWRGFGVHE